ncbi:hypothetical protein BD770DRAFT_344738 [Pilaira anomala]|nr:hypothetical protein BD770DRAFT_344738 [Pilaira anomala]
MSSSKKTYSFADSNNWRRKTPDQTTTTTIDFESIKDQVITNQVYSTEIPETVAETTIQERGSYSRPEGSNPNSDRHNTEKEPIVTSNDKSYPTERFSRENRSNHDRINNQNSRTNGYHDNRNGRGIQGRSRNNNQRYNNDKRYERNTRSSQDNWRSTSKSVSSTQKYVHPDDINHTKRKNFFKPYMDPVEMERKSLLGDLCKGQIRLTKNRYDAYVVCDELESDIYIGGLKSRNRALDGDLVVVRLIDVDEVWSAREADRKERSNEPEAIPQDENEDSNNSHKPLYCGEVVGISLRSPNSKFVGTIIQPRTPSNNNQNNAQPGRNNRSPLRIAWFKPSNPRIPLIILRDQDIPKDLTENPEFYKTNLYAATLSYWPIHDTSPTGKLLEWIGPLGEMGTENSALLADNNIITLPFTPVALSGLPEMPWTIPSYELEKRMDLRHELVFSIDPESAKDLDDALHFKVLEDGFYEVGVHIADVSYFLKRGSCLDEEALRRGTSTYLVGNVIPMLPTLLCEELCSLNPGVDRLAFSVIWKMDAYGKILSTWFGKTVIHSKCKLSYEDAQRVIDGEELRSDITLHGNHSVSHLSASIFMLNKLAMEMRKKRFMYGSLTLGSMKFKVNLNAEGQPSSIEKIVTTEANHLVEEFMLCANISVAKKISDVFPKEALLRRHDPPLERRLTKFIELMEELGFDFSGDSAGALQVSFDKIEDEDVKEVLLVLAIRCMQRAKYFCAGKMEAERYLHYALNEPVYTHFTSPIRRYADVVVHRLLEAALNDTSLSGYDEKSIHSISIKCNTKKDGSRNAQDASTNLYLAKYLIQYEKDHGPIITVGRVISVGKDAFEVLVPKYGLEAKFRLRDFPVQSFESHDGMMDIFWKVNVPVSMYNHKTTTISEESEEDEEEAEEVEEVKEEANEEESEKVKEEADKEKELVEKVTNMLDQAEIKENTCLQQLAIFSEIDVRIQVNSTRSPPIINVYPVNPFCEETIA